MRKDEAKEPEKLTQIHDGGYAGSGQLIWVPIEPATEEPAAEPANPKGEE